MLCEIASVVSRNDLGISLRVDLFSWFRVHDILLFIFRDFVIVFHNALRSRLAAFSGARGMYGGGASYVTPWNGALSFLC